MNGGKLPLPYRITGVVIENEMTKTFTLDGQMPAAQPGQFVMVWLPQIDERPFSLMDADPIRLTVAKVGRFTEAMHTLEPGNQMWLRGPIGHGFTRVDGPILLVGGGYGAAPLHFLARQARAMGQEVHVALGAKTASALILVDRFYRLGCHVHTITEDGSSGHQGLVSDLATGLLKTHSFKTMYGCGPEGMLYTLENLARGHNIPAQLSYEAQIMCAMGICGACAHGNQLVCRDGPVFEVKGG